VTFKDRNNDAAEGLSIAQSFYSPNNTTLHLIKQCAPNYKTHLNFKGAESGRLHAVLSEAI
jgi:hypothetical protein